MSFAPTPAAKHARTTWSCWMDEGVARALHTLLRGADFLGSGLWFPSGAGPSPVRHINGRCRARVIGNGLRELDRFLNVLLDETMTLHRLRARPDQKNTANKWSAFQHWRGAPLSHDKRLRALGRSRNCLFYCGGYITRGDSRSTRFFTAGWPEAEAGSGRLREFVIGEFLDISVAELAETCAFYRLVATDLFGELSGNRPRPCRI